MTSRRVPRQSNTPSPEEKLYGFCMPSSADIAEARLSRAEPVGFARTADGYVFTAFERTMQAPVAEAWTRYQKLREEAGGGLPKRDDMHPRRMPKLRDHIYAVEMPRTERPQATDIRYTSYGRSFFQLYNQDMTGKTLADIPAMELAVRLTAITRTLMELGRPSIIFGGFQSTSHAVIMAENLVLPLVHEDPDMQAYICVAVIEGRGPQVNLFAG